MNGMHLFNRSSALVVKVVNENVLCEHVPGENDPYEALGDLQQVLAAVLKSRANEVSFLRLEADNRMQAFKQFSAQKEAETRKLIFEVEQTRAELKSTAGLCSKLETENRNLEDRLKESLNSERKSSTNLSHASAQLQTMTGRCAQLEAEIDSMRTRLTEANAQLKQEQERKDWGSKKEAEDLRREMEETTLQKERTMERLGIANNTVARLQQDLKIAQETAEVSQSNVRRARSALDDIGSQVRVLRTYVAAGQTKRQRAEEDLEDERHAKRRLIEERDIFEARCRTRMCDTKKYEAERKQLEERLRVETQQRKEIETSLAQANAKLDRVVVTDSLIAAFVKMDQFAAEVVEGASH
ncbi:hypothetical protein JB92DRAFT_1018889 [Gautieria morchelliformis]|nr:hypothetical protein JB92DRAFT_1018889 [Gautieria morchelliformis]